VSLDEGNRVTLIEVVTAVVGLRFMVDTEHAPSSTLVALGRTAYATEGVE
jgi:hypothetical protein